MNLSPSLVVSPPLPSIEDGLCLSCVFDLHSYLFPTDSGLESFIFPGVMSAPAAPLGPLHEGKDTLVSKVATKPYLSLSFSASLNLRPAVQQQRATYTPAQSKMYASPTL